MVMTFAMLFQTRTGTLVAPVGLVGVLGPRATYPQQKTYPPTSVTAQVESSPALMVEKVKGCPLLANAGTGPLGGCTPPLPSCPRLLSPQQCPWWAVSRTQVCA